MEQLRVPKLLAGGLAAVSGAVVASFFGVEGTLIGAALVSMLVAPAEAVYTHSLASAHRVARRSLVRRVGDQAGASEEGASQEGASQEGASQEGASQGQPQPIRWQRVAVAAVLAFGIAVAAITVVEAVAKQPLASLVGTQPRQGGSTSVGVVVAGGNRSIPPATRAPGTSTTTSPSGPAPTTTAPVAVPTTTAPARTVPSTTAVPTTAPSTNAPTTQRR
jgi:hypothetical protein